MSDQHEIVAALQARLGEVEHELAALRGRPPVTKRRLSRRRAAAFGLLLALVAVPGVVLAGHRFSDVSDSNPFHDDIDWLAEYEIASGFADGTYRPGQAVTRQAMAAFLHRLTNEFEVVRADENPAAGNAFTHFARCPEDKRAIAGGGSTSAVGLLMTDSHPSGSSWWVRWESDDNASIDPSSVVVYALCAPRL